MTRLVQQAAELVADLFIHLMKPQRRGVWMFLRGNERVIVTVEVDVPSKEYESAVSMNGWKIPEEAVNVS